MAGTLVKDGTTMLYTALSAPVRGMGAQAQVSPEDDRPQGVGLDP